MLTVEQIDDIAARAVYARTIGSNVVTRTEVVSLSLMARELALTQKELKATMDRVDDTIKKVLTSAEDAQLNRALKRSLEKEQQKNTAAIQMRDDVMSTARKQNALNQRLVLGFTRALELGEQLTRAINELGPFRDSFDTPEAKTALAAVFQAQQDMATFIKANEA